MNKCKTCKHCELVESPKVRYDGSDKFFPLLGWSTVPYCGANPKFPYILAPIPPSDYPNIIECDAYSPNESPRDVKDPPKKRSKGPQFEEEPKPGPSSEISPPSRTLAIEESPDSILEAIKGESVKQRALLNQIHNQNKGLFEFLRKIFK